MMAAGLDLKLISVALNCCLPPTASSRQSTQGLGLEIGGFQAVSRSAGKVWRARSYAFVAQDGMPPEELQDVLWKQFFKDSTQWWDNRQSKPTPRHPDFKHKQSKLALWLNNRQKPAWVDSQLATLDAGLKTTSKSGSTPAHGHAAFAAHEGQSEVGMLWKLCEDGRTAESVDALDLLVQRGCHVSQSFFYRVLKRCIKDKDLVLGRRIHALTLESGYTGDAFLATHLIGLYASHGMLEEAMGVFTEVSAPDAYNWATIIFAYAKHGEAAQAAEAIQLYRQMRKSTTVKPDDRIYSAVLKACASARDLTAGKEVHAHILASPARPDRFVQVGLVDMYVKCGSIEVAREMFDQLPDKTVVAWTAMLGGYAQQGMGQQALNLYSSMQQEGFAADSVTFVCLLQACASVGVGALDEGKQLHSQIKGRGLQGDGALVVSLINMYSKCGSLEDSRRLFDRLRDKSVVAWNAMIAGYAQQGMGQEALSLYRSMQQEGLTLPNLVTYVSLLQACASIGVEALDKGKQLHAQIKERELQGDASLGSSLVNMYAKCGSLEDARIAFDKLSEKSVVAWTTMLAGYSQQGMGQEALSLYRSMQEERLSPPDSVTYVCMLQACASVGVRALNEGKQLHAQIKERQLEKDSIVGGSLVNMYAKCGSLDDALNVFGKLSKRNVVAWTTLLAGYVQHGMGQKAISLYSKMQQESVTPNSVTFVCLLQACASVGLGALNEGKQVHAQIKERGLLGDVVLGGSLVNMYAKCGSLEEARITFDELSDRDVVTWTAMIAGYAQEGMGLEALSLHKSMRQEGLTPPDSVTFVCLLQACASIGVGALDEGKQLHSQINERGLQKDVVLGGSLVNMYAKCGSLWDAGIVFGKLPERNIVAWNAMIAGYTQQGMGEKALHLYSSMQQEGLSLPDSVTYVSLLQACAGVAALPLGEKLHAEIREQGMECGPVVGAALVHMYAECGSMYDSQKVFDSLTERNVETWGALLSGYARQGDADLVFELLDRMGLEGIQPDGVTFLSVLTVCSHVGLVDKGRKYFEAMRTDYSITATVEHFTCMLDLLGRAGHLEEALQMAKTMPFQPKDIVWHTLLGACRKWKNVKIGEEAFKGAISLDENDAVSYVLMSNIYACAHMWEAARDMQARRMELGAWKKPGQSWWTDMGGVVHTFCVGEKTHPESKAIYPRIERLVPKMKKEAYVPHLG